MMNKHSKIEILELHSIRAIACIIVFLSHADWSGYISYLKGAGQFGVMIFFTLSGFLMAYLYSETSGKKEWSHYFLLRLIRIYPAYTFTLILTWLLVPEDIHVLAHLVLIKTIGHFWTIPVEIKFYFLFPFLIMALRKLVSYTGWQPITCLFVFYLLSVLIAVYAVEKTFFKSLPFFIAGMICSKIYANKSWKNNILNYSNLGIWLGMGIMILLFPNIFLNLFGFGVGTWQLTPVAPFLMIAIILFAATVTGLNKRILSSTPMVFLGNISFSFYLLHPIVMQIISRTVASRSPAMLATIFCTTVLCAYLVYLTVEQPSRRYIRRRFLHS